VDDKTTAVREQEQAIGHVVSTGVPLTHATTNDAIDMTRYNGKDIVKRPERSRRKKAVFILPASITLSGKGKLGTITKMDTGFPVMYIDFPSGRIKLEGRLVNAENSLMPISFKKSGDVVVKNAVKTLIVFSKTSWIGTAEENPDETPMPMPEKA